LLSTSVGKVFVDAPLKISDMLHHTINVAIQILPLQTSEAIAIIDKAIEVIKVSGLPHVVCPFETVIEGNYDEVMALVKKVQEACFEMGATEIITNLKIHALSTQSARIADKVGKYGYEA
jgi:uncharacterized protein (TIGR00106 family)